MFLIFLFSSFLTTEGLEIIIETSRRYTCLRDDSYFENGNNMEDRKDNGKCFRGRCNFCSERVYKLLGGKHTYIQLNTTKSIIEWEWKPSTQFIFTLTWFYSSLLSSISHCHSCVGGGKRLFSSTLLGSLARALWIRLTKTN